MAYNSPRTLSYIAVQTANNTATFLEFTSKINSSFKVYYVSIRDLVTATNNVTINLTFSTDNGSSYLASNYKYSYHNMTSGAGNASTGSTSASSAIFSPALSSAAANGYNADMYIYNLNDGTNPPYFKGSACLYNQASVAANVQFAGTNTGTTAITAIKFTLSSGNMASGNIYLYGVNE